MSPVRARARTPATFEAPPLVTVVNNGFVCCWLCLRGSKEVWQAKQSTGYNRKIAWKSSFYKLIIYCVMDSVRATKVQGPFGSTKYNFIYFFISLSYDSFVCVYDSVHTKLETMIIQQCKKSNATNRCNEILNELIISYHRASPNAEIKYTKTDSSANYELLVKGSGIIHIRRTLRVCNKTNYT